MLKKIINSSFFLLMGTILSRALMFLINLVAARTLPVSSFGQYMFLRNTISMLDGVLSASVGNNAIKDIGERQGDIGRLKKYVGSLIVLNLAFISLFLAIFLITGDTISKYLFSNSNGQEIIFFLSMVVFSFTILSSLFQKIMIALSKYREMAYISFICAVIILPLSYLMISNYSLNGLFASVAAYFFIDTALRIYYVSRILVVNSIKDYWVDLYITVISILKKSSYLVTTAIVSSLSFWLYRVIILERSGEFSTLANFDVAYQLGVFSLMVTGVTTNVALQMLSNKSAETRKVYRANMIVNLVIAIIFALVITLFSSGLLSLFGESYMEQGHLVFLVAVMTIFATVNSINNKLLISKGLLTRIFTHTCISCLVAILFCFFQNTADYSELIALTFVIHYGMLFVFDSIYIVKNRLTILSDGVNNES
ncbi:hypothetical protein [Enterovibrio calviensis]|uniref:hypothetical protein n=1 Tax=Enterovibrio calviensis TaxID=91359 RepID=UPI003735036A